MTTEGLGPTPRGPHFHSPSIPHLDPAFSPPVSTPSRRWPLVTAGGLVVLALAAGAGAGGAAGYLTGRDTPPAAVATTGAVPADLVAAAARALPGVVSVQVGNGSGSGFAFDDQGHIVTNNHVVAAGGPITVVNADGRRLPATLIGTDPGNDIAVLQVDRSAGLPALPLAAPRTVRVGEPVLAVGSPLGLSGTVTAGIISAVDRPVRLGDESGRTAIQTDASINPGNSGGPLVNARGEVIGVNTAIATLEGGGNIGIGFAVPIDRARQVASTLINRG
ncbi:S1C family serine protease [Paractinoplanes atraurantiacus]|uniref:Trypsin-like peptidase domain-containing protein n=1 Tax=Paractinoplanes atraurantiacus TaxID=1036182 RepID=A0A285IJI1_9ACTN|nr:trypsin-like peptidase domain-containing protein [Actinoplanes atraurantiacus]SNY48118.1 Trypsin-like peptidase domain-containing protein [Actinoplanes atraurantiacus]